MASVRCCVALLTLSACVADSVDTPRPDAGFDAEPGVDADIDADVPDVRARAVAAGGTSSAAVLADGTLWVWGALGNPDGRPALVDPRTDWTAVAVGGELLCGLRLGQLHCRVGEAMARVGSTAGWTSIDAGEGHACGLRAGTLACWGNNVDGQAGGEGDLVVEPRAVDLAVDWTQVSAGRDRSCGLRAGELYCWGHGLGRAPVRVGDGGDWDEVAVDGAICGLRAGQLFCAASGVPVAVSGDRDWTAVSAGGDFTCAGKRDGRLACLGAGGFGQLGVGDQLGGLEPRFLDGAWATFATGAQHACALGSDGALSCWGRNQAGQLGDGRPPDREAPARVGINVGWAQISHLAGHACGLRGAALYCWGQNDSGQLGLGDTVWTGRPRLLPADWSTVSAGVDHTCGVRDNGTLWCWGGNTSGQLGREGDALVPGQVGAASNWIEVAVGAEVSCGLRADGSLWCWGRNDVGQLGVGSPEVAVGLPTRVGMEDGWSQVSVGAGVTCGRNHGALQCAGGLYGSSMVVVDPATDWAAVAVRGSLACARKAGEAFCWDPASVPTAVDGDDWSYADPLCGLRSDGVWCGVFPPRMAVVAGSAGFLAVEASEASRCALGAEHGLWCWGEGASGVVGQGDAWRLRPVSVAERE